MYPGLAVVSQKLREESVLIFSRKLEGHADLFLTWRLEYCEAHDSLWDYEDWEEDAVS